VDGSRRGRRRATILDGALRCFARQGFRGTAMDAVAREAGISRAALYLHFPTKEVLFRALVEALHAQGLAAATAAAAADGPLDARVRGVVEAYAVRLFALVRTSPHAAEFLDENDRACGDLAAAARAGYRRLLARLVGAAARRGQLDLRAARLSADDAAALLLDAVDGVKRQSHHHDSVDAFRARIRQLVAVVLRGLGP
jgi:AcrR family transcriptional regulator